MIDKIL